MRKLKILIGGAESVFCDLRKAAREFWGFEVMEIADGKEACAASRTEHVDICILDWDLPKMTGLAACHWIRCVELRTQPYIVLLTEKGHPEQIQSAYAAGANDFLSKPFNAEDLHFLVSTFAQKISRLDLTSRELTHIDPVELYRRDLPAPNSFVRLLRLKCIFPTH